MKTHSHIFAGFSLGFKHRFELRKLLETAELHFNILKLDPFSLASSGIMALALDFDGVLAPHGDSFPLPEAIIWLKTCEATFGGEQIFILSNKPTEERRIWFAKNFPSIRFISGVRKKPYPDGIKKAAEMAKVPISKILMVDDRLLTGCLAAIVAEARPCYIRVPYASFKNRPFAELFFYSIRILERVLIKLST